MYGFFILKKLYKCLKNCLYNNIVYGLPENMLPNFSLLPRSFLPFHLCLCAGKVPNIISLTSILVLM